MLQDNEKEAFSSYQDEIGLLLQTAIKQIIGVDRIIDIKCVQRNIF